VSDGLSGLKEAIREEATSRTWSQGVQLARDDRVIGRSGNDREIEVEVRVPTRPTPFTVVLYPGEGEWECDCPSKEAVCSHVVAAVLGVSQARETAGAEALPTSQKVGGSLRYRLEPEAGGMSLSRLVVHKDGREEALTAPLASILSGRVPGPAVAATDADLLIDQLYGNRGSQVMTGDRLDRLLTVLADAGDVWLRDRKIRTSGEPVVPIAVVEDWRDGARLVLSRDPAVDEVISLGVVRVGDELRPVGETELQGGRLDRLPAVREFHDYQLPELVTKVLPALTSRLTIDVRTSRLPAVGGRDLPRVAFDVRQDGEVLSVLPTLVYGDPPRARIDGGRLVHLGGPVPGRDEVAEKELLWRLRDELNMVPGRRVEVTGRDAFQLNARLGAWLRHDARAAGAEKAFTLDVQVSTDNGLTVTFTAGERRASAEAVVRAWQAGADLVPLDGGGWGRVPKGWLDKHGSRVADLLAAMAGQDRVPTHALPDLARLCEDLDLPPPADVQRLRPLFESFERLPKAPLPDRLDQVLRHYQRVGVDWLTFSRDAGLGCVLADDMGLGKTLQALCAVRGRTLVVSPTSVVFNWADEIQRFRPDLKVAFYHGPRRRLDEEADVTLTSYPILRNDADELAAVAWDCVVLDESQTIKNPDSQVARAAYRLRAGWKLTLSGTPVENRLDELWSQIHFTNPGLLGGRTDFQDRYATPISAGESGAAARLRERIRPFVLRRLKRDVAPELPPRTDVVMHVELDDQERQLYDTIRAATQREVLSLLESGAGVMAALEALLRLRQAACHSGLIPGQSADGSSKISRLLTALEDAASDGHKALVFSQWTSLLDRIEPHLEAAGIAYTRLDGSTRDRAGVVNTFQDSDGPPVMLISLKAGGTGLNLTAADHVFLIDPWWNPAVEDQAADRAHRIGQDKPVLVYRLVAIDTVEERILALQASKRALADAALGEADRAGALTRDDLLSLLQ